MTLYCFLGSKYPNYSGGLDGRSTGFSVPEAIMTTSPTVIMPTSSTQASGDSGLAGLASSMALTTISTVAIATPVDDLSEGPAVGTSDQHSVHGPPKSISVWTILFVLLILGGIVFLAFYCFCRRWWRRFRSDRAKGLMTGRVDLRNVQLLGQTYKEKVRRKLGVRTRKATGCSSQGFSICPTQNRTRKH